MYNLRGNLSLELLVREMMDKFRVLSQNADSLSSTSEVEKECITSQLS